MASDQRDIHWENLQAALAQLESAVDQLTAVLPQERRELFLRLMVTLGLEESNPLLPIFVGLQFYVEYLKAVLSDMRTVVSAYKQELPAEMRTAADESLRQVLGGFEDTQSQIDRSLRDMRTVVDAYKQELPAELRTAADESLGKALSAYGDIQSRIDASLRELRGAADESLGKAVSAYGDIQKQIDSSVSQIDNSIGQIKQLRHNWAADVAVLLPNLKDAYGKAMEDSIAAYRAATKRVSEESLAQWRDDLLTFRNLYLRDVLMQGYVWGTGVALAVCVAVGWAGGVHGRNAAEQEAYSAFGGEANYKFAQRLMRRADNVERFLKCERDNNPKCTVWIQPPPPD